MDRSFSETLGCCFVAEGLSGNPFTGFTATDVKVLTDEGDLEVLHADKIHLKLGPLALLKGETRIRELSLAGSRLNLDLAIRVLKDMTPGASNAGILLESLTITDSLIHGKSGRILVYNGSLELDHPQSALKAEIKASFNDQAFLGSAVFTREEDLFIIRDLLLSSGQSRIELGGEIGEHFNLAGKITTPDISVISSILPNTTGARMKGGVDSTLEITGTFPVLHFEGVMQAHDFSVADFLFNTGVAHWSYKARELRVRDINARGFGSPVKGEMTFLFPGGPLMAKMDLHGKDMEVEKWYTPLKWLTFAEGKLQDIHVALEGPLRKLTGEIRFSSPYEVILSGNRLKDVEARVTVKNGRDISFQGNTAWYEAQVRGEGQISIQKPASTFDMDFETRNLDISGLKKDFPRLEDLGLQGCLAGNIHIQGKSGDLEILGGFKSDKVRIDSELLENVSFTFLHQDRSTEISSFTARWKGSSLSLQGQFNDLLGKEPHGDVVITSPSVQTPLNVAVRDLRVQGIYAGNSLVINSLTSELAGGKLDMQGQVSFSKPQRAGFSLSGITSGLKVDSLFKDLGIPLDLKGTGNSSIKISGNVSSPVLEMEFETQKISFKGFLLNNVRASLKSRDGILYVKGLKADMGKSPIQLSGTVSLERNKGNELDLKAAVSQLGLDTFIDGSLAGIDLEGVLSADISIKGTPEDPFLEIKAASEKITLAGMNLGQTTLETQPSDKGPQEYMLTASVGKKPIEITGLFDTGSSGWEATFDAIGTELDSAQLLEKVDKTLSHTVAGTFDLKSKGRISEGSIVGEGTLSSKGLSVYGIRLNTLTLPFYFKDNSIATSQGKATLYGGSAVFDALLDMKEGGWQANLDLRNTDLDLLTNDIPLFKGRLQGDADMALSLSGMTGKVYLLHGNGSLQVGEGSLSGVDIIKDISKDGQIPYRSIDAVYSIDGRNIYLMPGSRISAPPDNSIYKYLSVSGNVGGTQTPMDLKGSGNVNVQALGAFLGAIKGVIAGGNGGGNQVIMQDLLSGLVSSYTSRNFRRIAFEVRGTWDDPELHNLEILTEEEFTPIPGSDGEEAFDPEDIRFEVKFPTGEGTDTSNSAGEQFKQQVMDNLLKQIFPPDDDQGNSD
ncbi:MAG: hypothetical protein JW971_06205 [Synergistales bacterium]|nr:hypothetical protein [Synergistales bacterium]